MVDVEEGNAVVDLVVVRLVKEEVDLRGLLVLEIVVVADLVVVVVAYGGVEEGIGVDCVARRWGALEGGLVLGGGVVEAVLRNAAAAAVLEGGHAFVPDMGDIVDDRDPFVCPWVSCVVLGRPCGVGSVMSVQDEGN